MRPARPLAALALAALLSSSLGACAVSKEARAPAPPPPADPAPAYYPSTSTMPAGTVPQTPPAPTDVPSVTPTREADPLWLEFERFDREVALSTSDCATACRALASLERAAKRVCDGAAQLGEGGRCAEASKRLREARGRVRAACTRCAGGVNTDPDAPVP